MAVELKLKARTFVSFLNQLRQTASILAVSSFMVGCAENLVKESGIYYNQGLERSYNDLLLANVVRSAKGLPTYFSAVGDYSANNDISSSKDFSISSQLGELLFSELDFSGDTSRDFGRNANVSSLETEKFVQTMLTPLSPDLFFLLAEGRSRQRLDLLAALSIKWVLLPESTVVKIQEGALKACGAEAGTYSADLKALCHRYPRSVREASCTGPFQANSQEQILLRSEPTNDCEHARFRLLLEGVTILQPALLRNSAPESVTLLAQQQLGKTSEVHSSATKTSTGTNVKPQNSKSARPPNALLFGSGSNFALRSPNEILQYLGDVVKTMHATGSGPALTGADGKSIPIFEVLPGPLSWGSSIEVSVDGERFGIRTHRLKEYPKSFTLPSLAILKDIISVNTSQTVLPKNPTVFLR